MDNKLYLTLLNNREREQKLVDLCFEMVYIACDQTHREWFDNRTRDERMQWVANNLESCGFPTVPVGMVWGKITDLPKEKRWKIVGTNPPEESTNKFVIEEAGRPE